MIARTRIALVSALVASFGLPHLVHAQSDVLTLSNGDVLTGRIVQSSSEAVVLEHAVLGTITIEADRVVAMELNFAPAQADGPAAPAPEAPAASVAAAPPPADTPQEEAIPEQNPGLFGTSFLAGWNRRFEAGVSGAEGNTRTLDGRLAITGDYEDETDRWKASATYFGARSGGETTRNEFTAELLKDWLFPEEKWFLFATARYDFDQLQIWRHRIAGFGGIGYEFIESEKWNLRGRAGAGGNYRFGQVDDFTPEALLGLEAIWRISERQKLEAATTFYPSLEDLGEFRNISTVSWLIDLDPARGMSLRLGLENEYETDVARDEKRNDLKYFAALVFNF